MIPPAPRAPGGRTCHTTSFGTQLLPPGLRFARIRTRRRHGPSRRPSVPARRAPTVPRDPPDTSSSILVAIARRDENDALAPGSILPPPALSRRRPPRPRSEDATIDLSPRAALRDNAPCAQRSARPHPAPACRWTAPVERARRSHPPDNRRQRRPFRTAPSSAPLEDSGPLPA